MELRTMIWTIIYFVHCDISGSFVLLNNDAVVEKSSYLFESQSLPEKPLYFDVIFPKSDLETSSNDLQKTLITSVSVQNDDEVKLDTKTDKKKTTTKEILPDERVEKVQPRDGAIDQDETTESPVRSSANDATMQRRSASKFPLQPRGRGLADPGLGLGLPQKSPWDQDGPGISFQPVSPIDRVVGDETKDDVYTYSFKEDRFTLNGSASISYNGVDKFRITFIFSISGDGNASAELVTQEQEVKAPSWKGNDITGLVAARPDSCHLQKSQNKTTLQRNCRQRAATSTKSMLRDTSKRGRYNIGSGRSSRGRNFPFIDDSYSLTSQRRKASLSGSFIFPTNDQSVPLLGENSPTGDVMKDCDVNMTTYIRKWLCIGRSTPPCFMVLMQGSSYKVVEKICPQRVYMKRGYGQTAT